MLDLKFESTQSPFDLEMPRSAHAPKVTKSHVLQFGDNVTIGSESVDDFQGQLYDDPAGAISRPVGGVYNECLQPAPRSSGWLIGSTSGSVPHAANPSEALDAPVGSSQRLHTWQCSDGAVSHARAPRDTC